MSFLNGTGRWNRFAGCTRNMHFAYKVSATELGQRKGWLSYDLGCGGPMTHSPCNRILCLQVFN